MQCNECLKVFAEIGNALNAPIDTVELLESVATSLVREFRLKGCHFRLLSRDQKTLEHVASCGLSERYLAKGPVEADRSVSEALDGDTVMVERCSTDPRIQYPKQCAEEGIVSMLTVPLKTRGQVIGVVRLSTAEERTFTAQEIQVLEVVASFCAAVVVHWMFLSIVNNVTEAMRSSLDLDSVLNAVVRVITEALRAKGCVIELAESPGLPGPLSRSYGLSEALAASMAGSGGRAMTEARRGSCVLVLNAQADPGIPYRTEAIRDGVGSILHVPLMARDALIGVLRICTHRQYEFSEDEVFLLKGVGDHCAFAIRNAQMYADVQAQYRDLVGDFQKWSEQYRTFPASGREPDPSR